MNRARGCTCARGLLWGTWSAPGARRTAGPPRATQNPEVWESEQDLCASGSPALLAGAEGRIRRAGGRSAGVSLRSSRLRPFLLILTERLLSRLMDSTLAALKQDNGSDR